MRVESTARNLHDLRFAPASGVTAFPLAWLPWQFASNAWTMMERANDRHHDDATIRRRRRTEMGRTHEAENPGRGLVQPVLPGLVRGRVKGFLWIIVSL